MWNDYLSVVICVAMWYSAAIYMFTFWFAKVKLTRAPKTEHLHFRLQVTTWPVCICYCFWGINFDIWNYLPFFFLSDFTPPAQKPLRWHSIHHVATASKKQKRGFTGSFEINIFADNIQDPLRWLVFFFSNQQHYC